MHQISSLCSKITFWCHPVRKVPELFQCFRLHLFSVGEPETMECPITFDIKGIFAIVHTMSVKDIFCRFFNCRIIVSECFPCRGSQGEVKITHALSFCYGMVQSIEQSLISIRFVCHNREYCRNGYRIFCCHSDSKNVAPFPLLHIWLSLWIAPVGAQPRNRGSSIFHLVIIVFRNVVAPCYNSKLWLTIMNSRMKLSIMKATCCNELSLCRFDAEC